MIRFSRKGLTVCVFGILIICLAVANAGAAKKSDKEREGLVGPVKSVTEYTAECWEQTGQWVEGPRKKDRTVDYDRSGRMTRLVTYEDDGSVWFEEQWKYDARGWLVEEGFQGAFSSSTSYEYSDDGRVIKALRAQDAVLGIERGEHRYDSKGHLVEVTWFYSDGRLSTRDVFKYDDKGNRIEETAYNADGSLLSRGRYRYDAQGNEVEREWASYESDGSVRLGWKYQYQYDAKGNAVKMVSYGDDGTLDYREVYKYDASGNMIERLHYDKDGSLTQRYTFEYIFDSHANWIKQTRLIHVTKAGKAFWAPQKVIYRTITYY